MMRSFLAVVLPLLWASSLSAADDWRVVAATDPVSGAASTVAVVENAEGFQFEVEASSSRQSATCVLRLPDASSEALHAVRPLKLLVDNFDGQTVLRLGTLEGDPFDDNGDFMEVARRSAHVAPLLGVSSGEVMFRCWAGLTRQSSPTRGLLRQILEGERLIVTAFHAEGGSEETEFELQGAAEAIGEALDLPLEPTAKDHLQDELLGFRVQYRSSTCYLLAGKKNKKRCIAAVNECAERAHDSVVAMVGCVEVE